MGNWKYYQLIATFYRAYVRLIAQGVTNNDAINRTFEDFWFLPEENNVLCNMTSLVQYIEVKLSLDKTITIDLIDLFKLQLEKLSLIKLEEHLNSQEIEHFIESIDEVKYKIKALMEEI